MCVGHSVSVLLSTEELPKTKWRRIHTHTHWHFVIVYIRSLYRSTAQRKTISSEHTRIRMWCSHSSHSDTVYTNSCIRNMLKRSGLQFTRGTVLLFAYDFFSSLLFIRFVKCKRILFADALCFCVRSVFCLAIIQSHKHVVRCKFEVSLNCVLQWKRSPARAHGSERNQTL